MRIKKLIKNNRLLFRLISSYLISSVLLTGILMIIVTGFISKKITNDTREAASNQLRQSYATLYYALTDIYGDNYDLWKRIESSEEEIIQISNNLNRETIKNDLVDSVYLINKSSNRVISNISDYSIEDFYDQDAIRLFNEYEQYFDTYKNEIFFPRTHRMDEEGPFKNLISIVYANKNDQWNLDSGLIVNINQERLADMINANNNSSKMLIVNGVGQVISDSEGKFGQTLPRDDFYFSIANSNNLEDSFTSSYLGEKSFVLKKLL